LEKYLLIEQYFENVDMIVLGCQVEGSSVLLVSLINDLHTIETNTTTTSKNLFGHQFLLSNLCHVHDKH